MTSYWIYLSKEWIINPTEKNSINQRTWQNNLISWTILINCRWGTNKKSYNCLIKLEKKRKKKKNNSYVLITWFCEVHMKNPLRNKKSTRKQKVACYDLQAFWVFMDGMKLQVQIGERCWIGMTMACYGGRKQPRSKVGWVAKWRSVHVCGVGIDWWCTHSIPGWDSATGRGAEWK